jgi:aryl-alcohol dehydrogenase-like predicted oxidoreductase
MTGPRSRLALGTAQFGQHYGVANTSGSVPPDAVAAILARARDRGIDTLDTAIAYGESEAALGAAGVASWRVITKLPAAPAAGTDAVQWVERQVAGSLQRLRRERLDGLLLHRAADLSAPHGETLVRALAALKERDVIAAAGVSIYDPSELDALWPIWRPDIVQAPCNVLDRRLIQSGWLQRLAQAGVRVHLRSLFLQGLLLMPSAQRPAFFGRWRAPLDRWLAWCAERGESPLQAALTFVCALPEVERAVIGVDSVAQLEEILAAQARGGPSPPQDLGCEDRELLEPSRWQLA